MQSLDPIFSLLKPATPMGILDIGASYVAEDPPYKNLLLSGMARLIGFEPNEKSCEELRTRYGAPHKFFPFFIGDGTLATFHETNWVATGSLFPPNTALLEKFNMLHEMTTPVAQHAVQTKRLDDIPELGDVDFMKLDVQGSELSVLQHARRVLQNVTVLQVEVEFIRLYENQPLFADVDMYLRDQGFVFHTFTGFGSRCFKPLVINGDPAAGINQYLWSDAVYVRDWMNSDSIPTDKLVKFALICAEIMKSPDLCMHLLSLLDARTGSSHAPNYLKKLQGK